MSNALNTITLTPSALLAVAFNDGEDLTGARECAMRIDVLKYALPAHARVISESLSRAILTADPEQLVSTVVPIQVPGRTIYTLWRREDWLTSDFRRYCIALDRAAERQRRDTKAAKVARINEMARKLTDLLSGTESDYVQYRATIADLYYTHSAEDEATFQRAIQRIVDDITHRDFYIPLSSEILAVIAEEKDGAEPVATVTTTTNEDSEQSSHDQENPRHEGEEGAADEEGERGA